MAHVSLLINILIAYGAIQAFSISFIQLKSANRLLFKKLFAALLIIEGVTLFERLLVETEFIYTIPHVLGISHPISFLKPPLLWFMAYAITSKGFYLKKKTFLHFLPFGFMLLLNLPFYFMKGSEKINLVMTFMNKVPSYQSFNFYFSLSFFVYIGIYIFLSLNILKQFRQLVINNALANWYRIVLMIYSAFLILHLFYFLIQPIGQFNFALINQISMLAMTFIIQSIAFKLMDHSTLFNASPPDLSNLQKRKALEDLITTRFEQDKVYLADDLTLQKFAQSIAYSSADVSKIINQKFNCSFKKLVARYRINEAKHLMENAHKSNIKLIDITYQVGFNNKVSFYRSFKEFENISPSEYLEKIKTERKC